MHTIMDNVNKATDRDKLIDQTNHELVGWVVETEVRTTYCRLCFWRNQPLLTWLTINITQKLTDNQCEDKSEPVSKLQMLEIYQSYYMRFARCDRNTFYFECTRCPAASSLMNYAAQSQQWQIQQHKETSPQRNVSTKKRRQQSVRRSVTRAVDFILQRQIILFWHFPQLCWLKTSLNWIIWTYQLSTDTCRPADWCGRVMDTCESVHVDLPIGSVVSWTLVTVNLYT